MILYLGKYSKTNIYENIYEFLKKINVENEFNKFVIIKNEKIKTAKCEYLKNEFMLIQQIKENINHEQFIKILMSN